MKHEIKVYRLTLPKELREKAHIPRDGFVEITYDENTGNLIISGNVEENNSIEVKREKKVKKKVEVKTRPNLSNKNAIEANFMDAPNLSKNYFSECGLVVKTKNKYVNSFCERCRGQLAKEWEDKADVHCRYLQEEFESKKANLDKLSNDVNPSEEHLEIIEHNDIEDLRHQRKKDIEHITKSITEASKVIDKKIESLTQHSKKGRPKKQKRYSTSSTTIQPVTTGEDRLLKCSECGEFYSKGFLVDEEFMCKECTKNDFKEYLKRRGMNNV